VTLGNDLSSRLKFQQLNELFPSIDFDIVESVFYCNDRNIQKAIEVLKSLYPSAYVPNENEAKPPVIDAVAKKQAPSPPTQSLTTTKQPSPAPTVETFTAIPIGPISEASINEYR